MVGRGVFCRLSKLKFILEMVTGSQQASDDDMRLTERGLELSSHNAGWLN